MCLLVYFGELLGFSTASAAPVSMSARILLRIAVTIWGGSGRTSWIKSVALHGGKLV
jgi:hypothetical protein